MTTTDLAKFGMREKRMAADLLNAMCKDGLPDDFDDSEVTVMMNQNSGNVFLTNEQYEVAMMNGDKLESFYTCGYCGHEGFKDDFAHDPKNADCIDQMRDLGVKAPRKAKAR